MLYKSSAALILLANSAHQGYTLCGYIWPRFGLVMKSVILELIQLIASSLTVHVLVDV